MFYKMRTYEEKLNTYYKLTNVLNKNNFSVRSIFSENSYDGLYYCKPHCFFFYMENI